MLYVNRRFISMTENKKAAILIGGVCSAVLFSTGFTGRTEIMQTEKVVAADMAKITEIAEHIPKIHYTAVPYEETVQTVCLKVNEEHRQEIEEAKERKAEQEAKEKAMQGTKDLLASIIFCEAGNQPYEGQVAVGAVVMNRVRSASFPGTVEEVIYQSGQFTPALTGWLDQVRSSGSYTESSMQAAADALAGVNPVGECLYFDRGGSGMQIGDHFFH